MLDEKRLSYATEEDPVWKRWTIRFIEHVTGKPMLVEKYRELEVEGVTAKTFWKRALEQLDLNVRYDRAALEKLNVDGPLVLIANHPFGLVDGLVFAYLAMEIRPDFKALANSVLMVDDMLNPFILPVDFAETREAVRTNIKSKNEAVAYLKTGGTMLIFPGGGISTSNGWRGPIVDLEWKRFTARLIHEAQADVGTLYFHGANSGLFQLVSQFSLTLRLGLLLHEVRNKIGMTIDADIGPLIPYSTIAGIKNRKELIDHLREVTYRLGGNEAGIPNIPNQW